ncbi:MAG TPA: DUF488 family protein [Chloroflexota bacterium]|nr:DUF488 family protein [Chloroflexota bacterium]
MITLQIKSIYLEPTPDDGFRVLVDRQLPPGMTPESARVDLWLGEIAPSPRLQKWFRDDREKWDDFVESYYSELDDNSTAVTRLFQEAVGDRITLLFIAKDARTNTAVALKRYLEGEE